MLASVDSAVKGSETRSVDRSRISDDSAWDVVVASIHAEVASELSAGLRASGLELSADRQIAARNVMTRQGADLRRHLIWLKGSPHPSPGQGGPFEGRWVRALNSKLAFGAVAARVLADRHDGPGAPGAIECSALLHLGIGALDTLCDKSPGQGDELFSVLTEPMLVALCDGSADPWELDEAAAESSSEVSYVLGIVSGFFRTLGSYERPDSPVRRSLVVLLPEAYRAERLSYRPPYATAARHYLRQAREGAANLPFEVVATLVTGAGRSQPLGPGLVYGRMLGRAIAGLDDVSDIIDDTVVGALNGILLEAAEDVAALGSVAGRLNALAIADSTGLIRAAARMVAAELTALLWSSRQRPTYPHASDDCLLRCVMRWGSVDARHTKDGRRDVFVRPACGPGE